MASLLCVICARVRVFPCVGGGGVGGSGCRGGGLEWEWALRLFLRL